MGADGGGTAAGARAAGLTLGRAATILRMRPYWLKRMENGLHDPAVLAERWGWVKEREKAK